MASPTIPDLPERVARLSRKYGSNPSDPTGIWTAARASATPSSLNALRNLDLERVGRGQDPYSARASALGVTAASRQRPVTPEPDQSFWGDLTRNVSDIVRSVPHLPFAMVDEVGAAIHDTPDLLGDVASPNGPLATLGNVANLPGFRFIPGAYVAGAYGDPYTDPVTGAEVTPGGTQQLIDNPLFTTLDVLPYASKAAKSSRTVTRVTEAQAAQAAALGQVAPKPPRPIPTFLRNVGGKTENVADIRSAIINSGDMPARGLLGTDPPTYINRGGGRRLYSNPIPAPFTTENRVGRALTSSRQRFARTAPGQFISNLRDPLARATAERGLYFASYIDDPTRAARTDPLAASTLHQTVPELDDLAVQAKIDEGRMRQIHDALVLDDTAVKSTFTPEEVAYVDRFQSAQDALRDEAVARGQSWLDAYNARNATLRDLPDNGLIAVPYSHGTEIYDIRTGMTVLKARHNRDVASYARARLDEFRRGTDHRSADDFVREVGTILSDTRVRPEQRRTLARVNLEHARRLGFDVADLHDSLRAARTVGDLELLGAQVSRSNAAYWNFARTAPPLVPFQSTVDDAVSALSRTRDPAHAVLRSHLQASNWSDAKRALSRIKPRASSLPVDFDALKTAVDDASAFDKIAARLDKVGLSERALTSNTKRVDRVESLALPARWDDLARRDAQARLVDEINADRATGRLTPDQADRAIDAARANLLFEVEQVAPHLVDTIDMVTKEARTGWRLLADAGLDPRWVHRTTPEQAARAANPQILDNLAASPKQFKARLWDPTPSVGNLGISLSHQAYDLLQTEASKMFAQEMLDRYGVSAMEIQNRLKPVLEAARRRDPYTDRATHLRRLIEREYTPYDPASFTRGKGQAPRLTHTADQMYLPRTVAETLDRMRPVVPTPFAKAAGKPMAVFRTSLLPLSPRWHLYNILGGGVMTAATVGPRALLDIMEAFKMARNQGELLGRIEAGDVAMPPAGSMRHLQEWMQKSRLKDPAMVGAAHSLAAGHTIGRILREARESRAAQSAGRGFTRVTEASYTANQFFDNVYRSLSYLDGARKASKRGLSGDDAVAAGIHAARDALQSWDQLTPLERSGMRMVFPFYSWTRHLLSFVLQYPHDHPWRLAILSNVAATEFADNRTGLPAKFESMFTPFGVDSMTGETTGVFLDGANPFKDVTNWAMLAGFVLGQEGGNTAAVTSSLTPFITIPLEQAGFDTFAGTPDLYPDLVYDPTTGEMTTASRGNPLLNVAGSFIPQAEGLANLLGWNAEFRDIARRDPDAARQMLLGSVGIPSVMRQVNVDEERIKAEMRRADAMQQTKADAVRTGNFGMLDRYPVLGAYKAQLEQLEQAGVLAEYQPETSTSLAAAMEQQAALSG